MAWVGRVMLAPTPGAEDAALHSASTSAENSNCRCGKEVINRVPFGCEREICRNRRRSACRRSQWRACVVRTRPLWSCVMHQGRRASCAERGVLGRLMRAISADVVCAISQWNGGSGPRNIAGPAWHVRVHQERRHIHLHRVRSVSIHAPGSCNDAGDPVQPASIGNARLGAVA